MKSLILIMISTLSLFFSAVVFAHNGQSALFHLTLADEGNSLHMSVASEAVKPALEAYYPEIKLAQLSQQELKKLLVSYIKSTVVISSGDTDLSIGVGGIKMTDHQTDMVLNVANLPSDKGQLSVNITSFANNDHQRNVFRLSQTGTGNKKLMLTAKNNFKGVIEFNDSKAQSSLASL
jgi:hypothetical protein